MITKNFPIGSVWKFKQSTRIFLVISRENDESIWLSIYTDSGVDNIWNIHKIQTINLLPFVERIC